MKFTSVRSPIGDLVLAGSDAALELVWLPAGRSKRSIPDPTWVEDRRAFDAAARQLDEYFAGARQTFDLALTPRGTAFQQRVWTALLAIPYGETVSYGEIARRIEQPRSVRAVGLANGSNPIPIIIPCHRVIGSGGALTGYGGGLPIKRYLLDLERGRAPRGFEDVDARMRWLEGPDAQRSLFGADEHDGPAVDPITRGR